MPRARKTRSSKPWVPAKRIELVEKLRGWTWKGKVGKPSKTAATGIQARPKNRRLSEAGTSNRTIGDASETCSDFETDHEGDDDGGDVDDVEVVLEDRDGDDDAGDLVLEPNDDTVFKPDDGTVFELTGGDNE